MVARMREAATRLRLRRIAGSLMRRLSFGKSLCHSWASGPAFLIPGVFLGVRPTSDGWRTYEAKPVVPGFAKGARVVVPTASGFVRVDFK